MKEIYCLKNPKKECLVNILYPTSLLNINKIDEMFQEEANALSPHFFCSVSKKLKLSTEKLLYRGWMLTEKEYYELENSLPFIIPFSEYESNHYFLGWYETIKDLTIESIVCQDKLDAVKKFKESGWSACFVKDAVKSLTTSRGSVVKNENELKDVLEEIERIRGIERYIVLRKVVNLQEEKEIRYFCVRGKVFSPLNVEIDPVVLTCGEKLKSRTFCSIDATQDETGKTIIVEVGDGQVSDLKMWSTSNFVKVLKEI